MQQDRVVLCIIERRRLFLTKYHHNRTRQDYEKARIKDEKLLINLLTLYRKWSNKLPGAYLSKWVLGEGAYSGGGGGG